MVRRPTASVLALVASLVSTTCFAQGLKVGAIFSYSGAQSTYGEEAINGIELALSDLKISDPALAAKITVIKEDDKSNPVDATVAAKKLLSVDKVDLIFGSIASSHTLSMSGAVLAAGKPLVTPGSTNPEVTKKGDLIFRTCFMDPFQGSVLANFALNHLHKKKAAILLDHKSDYSRGLAQVFEESFKAGGGEIVAVESYEAGKKDFATLFSKIRAKRPDVIVIPGYYQEVGLMMKQVRQMGFNVTLLGSDGWDSPTLFQLAGKEAVKNHYFSTHFSAEDTDPAVQKFAKAYTARFKKAPGAISALSYEGFQIIADAYKRAQSADSQAMKKALASTKNFKGLTGSITINAERNAEKDAVILKTLEDRAAFETRIGAGAKAP